MTRIVFMGTPEFAVPALQKLIETQNVVGVVTQPDRPAGRGKQLHPSPVKVAALAASLPVYQPHSMRQAETVAPLRDWQPDMIIVAAFGQILRPIVLDLPTLGCLNIHASLLPRWRGASPIQHAILSGDRVTGVTLMKMDVGLDTGAMYVQESFPLTGEETAASLHDRLADLGASMLVDHLPAIINGQLLPQSQDDALATYAPMISKNDGQIDWRQDSSQIYRQLRAMTPWPGAFSFWDGQLLKIKAAQPVDGRFPGEPGQVTAVSGPVVVRTGKGGLQLDVVQLAGKKAMAAADFVRGHPDLIGSILQAVSE